MIRSALVLKLHQFEDTGAIIASATTSLELSDAVECSLLRHSNSLGLFSEDIDPSGTRRKRKSYAEERIARMQKRNVDDSIDDAAAVADRGA